jgi:hypothetical protein
MSLKLDRVQLFFATIVPNSSRQQNVSRVNARSRCVLYVKDGAIRKLPLCLKGLIRKVCFVWGPSHVIHPELTIRRCTGAAMDRPDPHVTAVQGSQVYTDRHTRVQEGLLTTAHVKRDLEKWCKCTKTWISTGQVGSPPRVYVSSVNWN